MASHFNSLFPLSKEGFRKRYHPEADANKFFAAHLFEDLIDWIDTMIYIIDKTFQEFGNLVGLQISVGRISQVYNCSNTWLMGSGAFCVIVALGMLMECEIRIS